MSGASGGSSDVDDARAAARLAWARTATGDGALLLERASADAGFRSYWRTQAADGSRIVMDSPPGLEDVRPWLRMRDLLEAGGVRVPSVLARDADAGFLLLEDLGHLTCLQALPAGNGLDEAIERTIDGAIGQLLRLQAIACPPEFSGYGRALVERDMGLFRDWFLERHLGVVLDDAARAALSRAEDRFVASMAGQAQVLVHRDFILRNLMPAADGPAVLDFQDAVRGPIAYDVLSLFKDAFVGWPEARVDGWIGRYHARAHAARLPVPELQRFRRDVDLMGAQRHLKILGIFARLHHRDGKSSYLADAPRFVDYLRTEIPDDDAALGPLRELLERHVMPRYKTGR